MKWSILCLVLVTFISCVAGSLVIFSSSIFCDVAELRKCDSVDCERMLHAVKELALNPDFEEASEALRIIDNLPIASKDWIYKTWYFDNDNENEKIDFSPTSEILKHCKHPQILKAFREIMSQCIPEGTSAQPDFERDSIAELREKIKLIFKRQLHGFIFTNPNKRKWTLHYSQGISFYSSTYEILEENGFDEEDDSVLLRQNLKELWEKAEDVGFVSEERVEALKNSTYAEHDPESDLVFTHDVVHEEEDLSSVFLDVAGVEGEWDEERIRRLNGVFSIAITHSQDSENSRDSEDEDEEKSEDWTGSEDEDEEKSEDSTGSNPDESVALEDHPVAHAVEEAGEDDEEHVAEDVNSVGNAAVENEIVENDGNEFADVNELPGAVGSVVEMMEVEESDDDDFDVVESSENANYSISHAIDSISHAVEPSEDASDCEDAIESSEDFINSNSCAVLESSGLDTGNEGASVVADTCTNETQEGDQNDAFITVDREALLSCTGETQSEQTPAAEIEFAVSPLSTGEQTLKSDFVLSTLKSKRNKKSESAISSSSSSSSESESSESEDDASSDSLAYSTTITTPSSIRSNNPSSLSVTSVMLTSKICENSRLDTTAIPATTATANNTDDSTTGDTIFYVNLVMLAGLVLGMLWMIYLNWSVITGA